MSLVDCVGVLENRKDDSVPNSGDLFGDSRSVECGGELECALGDKQASETKTFQAVTDAIRELAETVNFIVKSLNGSTVFLTADHGFLYQESAMSEADRSKLEAEPAGAIKAKKRYLLGRGLGSNPKAWSGNTSLTAGTGTSFLVR